VLRACRRLLRRGGRTAFLTIVAAPGLTPAQRRVAARSGPPAVLTRIDQANMLRAAGFDDVVETDLTAEYLTSVRSWLREAAARESDLRSVIGDSLFEERQNDRRLQVTAIEAGLLRRALFVAVRGVRAEPRRLA
jgi:hypothetical protein